MTVPESRIDSFVKKSILVIRGQEMAWQDDTISLAYGGTQAFTAANNARIIGACAALRGATEQVRDWHARAASMYTEAVRHRRARRDRDGLQDWNNEPATLSMALDAALVGRDEAVLQETAECALEMEEAYLDAFSGEPALRFFNTKTKAVLATEADRVDTYLEELKMHIDEQNAQSPYWQAMPTIYQSLVTDSPVNAQTGLEKLLEFKSGQTPDTDSPSRYVLTEVGACIVLGRRYGMDLSVESDRVPDALVAEEIPQNDATIDLDFDFDEMPDDEKPPDVDVEALECTKSGVFDLYLDDDTPVIAGRMYHASPEPVSAADVPEQNAGRLLSDEWVETALEEADRRDHYDEELVDAAQDAYADGTLDRELVVVQDRTDGGTFDESVAELPIDGVEILKGAPKLD